LKDNSINDNTTVPGLVEAKEILKRSNMTEAERNTYLRHLEAMQNEKSATQYSYASGKVDGRIEGIAEGRAEGEKIGIEKGRAEGLQQGRTEQLVESIKNLISNGFDFDKAVEVLRVSADQIQELRRMILIN
jgi:flagellar biosynthesis/type III secretory pathway protein FliH